MGAICFRAVPGMGEIAAGTDLVAEIVRALGAARIEPACGDVLVIAQKIVSKAEGRLARLGEVEPRARARELAAITGKDARLVELVLRESVAVVRAAPKVLIVRHRIGYVMANAGIDRSNVAGDEDTVLLLPEDPDDSARRLRAGLERALGHTLGVIVSDSFGRPWRIGVTNVALGVAGLAPVVDRRGEPDRRGRRLEMTQVAVADAIAAGAGLAMGEAAEGTPVVLASGIATSAAGGDGRALLRPPAEDLFA